MESHVFSWSRSRFFKIAGIGVGFSKMLEFESGVGFKKVGSLSQFFELELFMGWSLNPKKSSDSTTLIYILPCHDDLSLNQEWHF